MDEAEEDGEERHDAREQFEGAWPRDEGVVVVVGVDEVGEGDAREHVAEEEEIEAEVLVAGTLAQEHAVVVALQHASVARETVGGLETKKKKIILGCWFLKNGSYVNRN